MSAPIADDRAVAVRIGRITVQAASAIDARRLADGLPAALADALAGRPPELRPSAAERAAREIVAAIDRARAAQI